MYHKSYRTQHSFNQEKPVLMFYRNITLKHIFACLPLLLLFIGCEKFTQTKQSAGQQESVINRALKKNIIIILEDDIGYEVPTYTGGQSYSTRQMDLLAQSGMQFTHCYSSAMCSPSRIMLLTGKYGFRNYYEWGILDSTQKTIANLLHNKGYATCAVGKWQLDGHFKKFGFDEHCVFDPFEEADSLDIDENRHRYKNPAIYQNGAYLPESKTEGKYSDDIFAAYATNFIERKKDSNFFLYFSFSECHTPFSPPPNHNAFARYNPLTAPGNKTYFPYMVKYMDSKINAIMQKLADENLLNNTYVFILGDNGTETAIVSKYKGRDITGGKHTTTEFGLHVPLILLGPGIQPGSINRNIVDFSDFLPTIASITGTSVGSQYGTIDGQSFYNQFTNPSAKGRSWSYGYYFPYPANAKQKRVYVHDTAYKLYDASNSNRFYNLQRDSLEASPIASAKQTSQEKIIKNNFNQVLLNMHK